MNMVMTAALGTDNIDMSMYIILPWCQVLHSKSGPATNGASVTRFVVLCVSLKMIILYMQRKHAVVINTTIHQDLNFHWESWS